MKLSAAWLIEQSGFKKGYIYKSAGLSEKHTLAMINRGKTKAADIYEFSNIIIDRVYYFFKVKLEREAVLLGEFVK